MIKKSTVYNFFKFLEDKRGEKIPLNFKLLYYPQDVTKEDLNVKGDLFLFDSLIEKLPNNLDIGGNLNIGSTNIKKLPDNIRVGGNLVITNTNIKRIPDDIFIEKSLDASASKLEYLPDNLILDHNLNISGCEYLKELPRNLKVGEHLFMHTTNIKRLPDDIEVGIGIYAINSKLEYLPNSLHIQEIMCHGSKLQDIPYNLKLDKVFIVRNTPLAEKYTEEEIIKMIEDRGGYVKKLIS